MRRAAARAVAAHGPRGYPHGARARWMSNDTRVVAADQEPRYLDEQLVVRAEDLARRMVMGATIDPKVKAEIQKEVAQLSQEEQFAVSAAMDDAMLGAIEETLKKNAPEHTHKYRIADPDQREMSRCLLQINKLRHELVHCPAYLMPIVSAKVGYQRLRLFYYYQRVLASTSMHFVGFFMCVCYGAVIIYFHYARHASEYYLFQSIKDRIAFDSPVSTYRAYRGRKMTQYERNMRKNDPTMTDLSEHTHVGRAQFLDDHYGGLDLQINPADDHLLHVMVDKYEMHDSNKEWITKSVDVQVPFTDFLADEGL